MTDPKKVAELRQKQEILELAAKHGVSRLLSVTAEAVKRMKKKANEDSLWKPPKTPEESRPKGRLRRVPT